MSTRTYKNFIILVLVTFTFISTYYLLMPALPIYIVETLRGSKFEAGLVMGIFFISSLIIRPASGRILETWGFKRVMYLCTALFAVTPLLFFLFPSLITTGINQIIYGITVGAFTIAVVSCTSYLVPPEDAARLIGWHSIAIISAKGFSPAIGDFVFKNSGFSMVVFCSLLACAISVPLIYGLDEPDTGEKKDDSPTFFQILKNRSVYFPTLMLLSGMFTFGAIVTLLPLFAKTKGIENVSPFFISNTAAVVFIRIFMKNFSHRVIIRNTYISMLMLIISLFLMPGVQVEFHLILIGILYGLGYGVFYPCMSGLLIAETPPDIRPTALGIYTTGFDLGVAIGTFVGGLSEYIGFTNMYYLSSIVPILGLIYFSFYVRNRNKKTEKSVAG